MRGLESISRVAEGTSDPRYLTPWAVTLLHLDRRNEARPIVHRLEQMGYRDVQLRELCESKGL